MVRSMEKTFLCGMEFFFNHKELEAVFSNDKDHTFLRSNRTRHSFTFILFSFNTLRVKQRGLFVQMILLSKQSVKFFSPEISENSLCCVQDRLCFFASLRSRKNRIHSSLFSHCSQFPVSQISENPNFEKTNP